MTVSAPRLVLSDCAAASAIVAFVAITRAPKLLTSLARKVPPDIVPMPVDRLSSFCRRVRGTPIALNGLVVCVPEESLPEEDRAVVDDLGRLIPVLRIHDDPREAGRAFFERCREAAPRVPRAVDRFEYRRPVVVAPGGGDSAQRRLLAGRERLSRRALPQGPLLVLRPRRGAPSAVSRPAGSAGTDRPSPLGAHREGRRAGRRVRLRLRQPRGGGGTPSARGCAHPWDSTAAAPPFPPTATVSPSLNARTRPPEGPSSRPRHSRIEAVSSLLPGNVRRVCRVPIESRGHPTPPASPAQV